MAPRVTKQAKRSSSKNQRDELDEEPASGGDGGLSVAVVKALVLDSCIAQLGPKLPALLKDETDAKAAAPKESDADGDKADAPKESGDDKGDADGDGEPQEGQIPENGQNDNHGVDASASQIFESLQARLTWNNGLGLAASAEVSSNAWLAMKGLELDWGPRSKKKGSPAIERISTNLAMNLPQYVYALMALMMFRAFFLRSFFACLPWMFLYQFVSLALPLNNLEKLPQVPLEKVPTKFRVAGSLAIHAFVWLFFVYELLWCTYFFEKIPLLGLITYHAYAFRPSDAWMASKSS